MKKIFLGILICAIVSFGLMGCGKKAGTEHPSGQEQPKSEHPK